MSNVTLNIGPKSYVIACADGQEDHIAALGAMIAEKYAQLGTSRAPLEAQNLLFAALFLADELAEARKHASKTPAPDPEIASLRQSIEQLESELESARKASTQAPLPTTYADRLGDTPDTSEMAERMEALASQLEANAAALEAVAASA